jgi:peptide/nickel transport system ATP-binding protein
MSGLAITDLAIAFGSGAAARRAPRATPVRSCSLRVGRGEVVGLVGESGCGKSLTALACLGLLPAGAVATGSIRVGERELIGLPEPQLAQIRGRRVAMIFQNPMTALNPYFTVGRQLASVIRTHFALSHAQARARVAAALERVQLAPGVAARYPHEMSGGQLQRVMIALAVACEPDILVADEPTTALDVTIQARIVQLLRALTTQGMGLLLISHDLELVTQVSERMYVMYAGRVVESGTAREVFHAPSHPYTAGLVRTLPHLAHGTQAGLPMQRRLPVIAGRVPPADALIRGCVFANRCGRAAPACTQELPPRLCLRPGSEVACHQPILPPYPPDAAAPMEQTHAGA